MKIYKCTLFCLLLLYLVPAKATDAIVKDGDKYVTISGVVRDKSDKKVLAYASISIVGGT